MYKRKKVGGATGGGIFYRLDPEPLKIPTTLPTLIFSVAENFGSDPDMTCGSGSDS
jgi:hypothetical protein